ncbi:hypothetical protein P9112_012007 [Eukaryota sp. TZLM1-RC]
MGKFDKIKPDEVPGFNPKPKSRFGNVEKIPEYIPKALTAPAVPASAPVTQPPAADTSSQAEKPVVVPDLNKLRNEKKSQDNPSVKDAEETNPERSPTPEEPSSSQLPAVTIPSQEPRPTYNTATPPPGLENTQTHTTDDEGRTSALSSSSSKSEKIQYSKDTFTQMKDHCPADNELTKRLLEMVSRHNNLSQNANRGNRSGNNRGGSKRGQPRGSSHSHSRKATPRSGIAAQPLPKSANAYDINKQRAQMKQDAGVAVRKHCRGLLNKLSGANKGKIIKEIVDVFLKKSKDSQSLNDDQIIELQDDFTEFLFDKATLEPTFMTLYAELCKELTSKLPATETDQGFNRRLVHRCQTNFQKYFLQDEEWKVSDAEIEKVKRERFKNDGDVTEDQLDAERFYRERKLKAQILGNIEFVATLILEGVFEPGVAAHISGELVKRPYVGGVVEALVTLWTRILQKAAINEFIDTVASKVLEFSKDEEVDTRSRCLCANFYDFYLTKKEQHENQSRLLAEQKAQEEESRRQEVDGFTTVKGRKGRTQDVRNLRQTRPEQEISEVKVKDFIKKLDQMGIEDAVSAYADFGVRLNEKKVDLLALVLYTFINKNPKVEMINHFFSIFKVLVERGHITKNIIVSGFNKFMETKLVELMEDFPLCPAVIAKFVMFWLEKGYITHSIVVDAFSKIEDEFTREDVLKPFKAYLEEIGEDAEWLVLEVQA